jgi:N-dimethylarginine dimethylaminohydrolase
MENIPANFRTRKEEWKGNFIDWLREDGWDIIEITDKECFNMAANFLTVDEDLAFHYTGNPRVMKEVNKRGIDIVQIPGEEMRKGMGGIHCMTCPVLRV